MYKKVKGLIAQKKLIRRGDIVAAAVSGGADSMALLHILKRYSLELRYTLYCLHLEHGIRGEESKKDAEFVGAQCASLGIPCFVQHADIPKIAMEHKESVEEAARRERYAYFDSMTQCLKIDKIAVAHHMDDQAETALFNLIRGTGIKGLTAMEYEREPNIIRPLLGVSKEEILEYVRQENIPYVLDATNEDTKYMRNRIRKILFPAIKMINPKFTSGLMRLLDILREDDAALHQLSEAAYKKCQRRDTVGLRLNLKVFSQQPKAVKRRIIRIALNEHFILKDIEFKHVDSICKLAETRETGKAIDIKNQLIARIEYGDMVIERKKGTVRRNGIVPLSIENGVVFMHGGMQFDCMVTGAGEVDIHRKAPNEEYFDYDKFPKGAVIRFRAEGDMFHPLNFIGRKKLKNYLSDKKIPVQKRDYIPLVADGKNILWVTGYGISDDVKIDDATSTVLKIVYRAFQQ
jgi:tRNA(Ile)-lysidine synthase